MPRPVMPADMLYGSPAYLWEGIEIFEQGHTQIGMVDETCHRCEAGISGRLVFSEDTDATAPWVCEICFIDANDCQPEHWPTSQRDLGDDEYTDEYAETSSDDLGENAQFAPILVPNLPGRITRTTSVEIEVGMGGSYLAQEFHDAGLSPHNYMLDYHSRAEGFVRVEEDSSVAAEIVFNKMRLWNPVDATKFANGIHTIRAAIREGRCRLDMRCGLHIHVGLQHDKRRGIHPYSKVDCESLYHLWNYLEDTIFRLAAANWSAHRSLRGNDYSPVKSKTAGAFVYDRASLNLGNYFESKGYNCVLGGGDCETWECYCEPQGVPTVEFRVFNTSANARKIRAYVALCQALVNFAQGNLIIPADYPVFGFTNNEEADTEASKERMQFILCALPLTDEERDDLRYCFDKSSLKDAYAAL